ncbi:MAG TPA: hypothetical protein PK597_07445 [Oscillospiraceae bacterium]|nr:hypothetical protein [Oscillospiraceae bacterium]
MDKKLYNRLLSLGYISDPTARAARRRFPACSSGYPSLPGVLDDYVSSEK